ncbi:MAG TPA: response regulator [Cytophagaceae bacterium]
MNLDNYLLLIDDDPVNNFMVERLIKKLSPEIDIKICRNGKEGLKFLESNACKPPKIIILDVNMPVMDGFEFLECYQKLAITKEKTKVILATTIIKEEDYNDLPVECELILKPITADKILKIVTEEVITPMG